MRKVIILLLLHIALFIPMESVFAKDITLTTPKDGANVEWRTLVQGTASGVKNVWVIVHSLETSEYWVQPKAMVTKKGNWKVKVYIGNVNDSDNSRDFEIRAIANPYEKITVGQIYGIWPAGELNSDVVRVVKPQ